MLPAIPASNSPARIKRTRFPWSPYLSCGDAGGFTLIELMIAIGLAALILAAVYMALDSQQKTQIVQQRVVEMQQNLRGAAFMLQRDIRMAGFDPTWEDADEDGSDDHRSGDGIDNDCDETVDGATQSAEAADIAGIVTARPHLIKVRLDRNADGDFCDSEEVVAYGFPNVSDGNQDGIADRGSAQLKRGFKNGPLNQPIAEDIQAVSFAYAYDYDDGAATTDGKLDLQGGRIVWAYDSNGDGTLDTALDANSDGRIEPSDDKNGDGYLNDSPLSKPVPLKNIRAVKIWLLARTRTAVRDYSDKNTYVAGNRIIRPGDANGDGEVDGSDAPDHFRRELLATTVICRNMGLR